MNPDLGRQLSNFKMVAATLNYYSVWTLNRVPSSLPALSIHKLNRDFHEYEYQFLLRIQWNTWASDVDLFVIFAFCLRRKQATLQHVPLAVTAGPIQMGAGGSGSFRPMFTQLLIRGMPLFALQFGSDSQGARPTI